MTLTHRAPPKVVMDIDGLGYTSQLAWEAGGLSLIFTVKTLKIPKTQRGTYAKLQKT